MTEDHRDLVSRLFATATAMLEDTIAVAAAGQSAKRRSADLANCAHRLQAAARDIATIAEAALIVTHLGDDEPGRGGGKRPR